MKAEKFDRNIMILGTDQYGLMVYDAFMNDPLNKTQITGFIKIDGNNNSLNLEGLDVFEFNEITADFVNKHTIDEVIISVQNVETIALFDAAIKLLDFNVKLKIIPPAKQGLNDFVDLNQIEELTIDHLLLRTPKFDVTPLLLDEYHNQIILVTGAAGSIGSELVKQLTTLKCKVIILVDHAESALYDLQQELLQIGVSNFIPIIADIRDYRRMDYIFNVYKPKIVFHAAAYKHVPLMEEHPYEAVNVNVIGTKNLALASVKHGIHKFILISSDKAVNPTNVMGATKRIAELYIGSIKEKGQTKFITMRFGNVMASNGSVIPLFNKQIETGGPVTVSHKDIQRYFITAYEVCHLILEAGSMGNGKEIYVFEMGQSVKIYDLAKMMIKLSKKDVPIKITGLRPGEKVIEELLAPKEQAKPTYHTKIKVAQKSTLVVDDPQTKILELCNKASNAHNLELVALIKTIVPEYISRNSKYEVLDPKKK